MEISWSVLEFAFEECETILYNVSMVKIVYITSNFRMLYSFCTFWRMKNDENYYINIIIGL